MPDWNPFVRLGEGLRNAAAHPFQTAARVGGNMLYPGAGLALGALFDRYNQGRTADALSDAQGRFGDQVSAGNPWGIGGPLAAAGGGSGGMPGITGPWSGGNTGRSPLMDYLGLGDWGDMGGQDNSNGLPGITSPWAGGGAAGSGSAGGGARPSFGGPFTGFGSIGQGGGATATNAGNWGSYSGLGSMNPTGGTTADGQLLAAYLGMNLTR